MDFKQLKCFSRLLFRRLPTILTRTYWRKPKVVQVRIGFTSVTHSVNTWTAESPGKPGKLISPRALVSITKLQLHLTEKSVLSVIEALAHVGNTFSYKVYVCDQSLILRWYLRTVITTISSWSCVGHIVWRLATVVPACPCSDTHTAVIWRLVEQTTLGAGCSLIFVW